MEIIEKRSVQEVEFCEINLGVMFEYDGIYYLRAEYYIGGNCVNFMGMPCELEADDLVIPVKRITIEL